MGNKNDVIKTLLESRVILDSYKKKIMVDLSSVTLDSDAYDCIKTILTSTMVDVKKYELIKNIIDNSNDLILNKKLSSLSNDKLHDLIIMICCTTSNSEKGLKLIRLIMEANKSNTLSIEKIDNITNIICNSLGLVTDSTINRIKSVIVNDPMYEIAESVANLFVTLFG